MIFKTQAVTALLPCKTQRETFNEITLRCLYWLVSIASWMSSTTGSKAIEVEISVKAMCSYSVCPYIYFTSYKNYHKVSDKK